MDIHEKIELIRRSFESGITKNLDFRREQLKSLVRLFEENEERIVQAATADMKKSVHETLFVDYFLVKEGALNALRNLDDWSKDEKTGKDLANILDEVYVKKEPYGVVLIFGSWNISVHLCMLPLVGALAAGNCCVLKPSELTPNVSKLLKDLVSQYLDSRCFLVCEGGVETTERLLKERFDYIFFTGSKRIGKIVHKAANEFLTPVTLELGGKCPVYIDSRVNLSSVAEKIMWGKFGNAGQICISPDYVLCEKKIEAEFVEACRRTVEVFYTKNPKQSPDLSRIINSQHYKRILNLIKGKKIVLGGDFDPSDNYISPTIITEVDASDLIMQEEIFGPVLPIFTIENHSDAIKFINSKDKPLVIYIFSNDEKLIKQFMNETSSGSVVVNDTISQFFVDHLPFGGVGGSGMGAYHGKHTFDLFTHKKGVLKKRLNYLNDALISIRYPPYSDKNVRLLFSILKKRSFWFLKIFKTLFVVSVVGYVFIKCF